MKQNSILFFNLVFLFIYSIEGFIPENREVCTTPKCFEASRRILSSIDDQVDPCQNFNNFACGRWAKNHPIPDTSSVWSPLSILEYEIQEKLKQLLERTTHEKNDSRSYLLAQTYYRACLSQSPVDDVENQDKLRDLVELFLSQYSYRDRGDMNSDAILALPRKYFGGNYLFSFSADIDLKDSGKIVVNIDQPEFGIDRAYLTGTDFIHTQMRNSYMKMIRKFWTELFNISKIESEKIAREILDFEMKLAQASTAPEVRMNYNTQYNPMSIDELQNLNISFFTFDTRKNLLTWKMDWRQFLVQVFFPKKFEIDATKKQFVISDLGYFEKVGSLNMESLRNYLTWRILWSIGGEASLKLTEFEFEFVRETTGQKTLNPRWRRCTRKTSKLFGETLSSAYAQKFLANDEKVHHAQYMTEYIHDAFHQVIDESDWISYEEKEIIKTKVQLIKDEIYSPIWAKNNEYYYQGLGNLNPSDNFQNFLDTTRFFEEKDLHYLVQSFSDNLILSQPTEVNAYYSPRLNKIELTEGILEIENPLRALDFGSLGSIIGHEQSHAFDWKGVQFNEKGNIKKFLPEQLIEKFRTKFECFTKQYSHYYDNQTGLYIDGVKTLGENIADTEGVRQSFLAFSKYRLKYGSKRLPGVNYSPEQLFFLSFAQMYCSSYRTEELEDQILTEGHPPYKYRILGVVQNSKDFAEAWKCKKPNNLCKIW